MKHTFESNITKTKTEQHFKQIESAFADFNQTTISED